MDGQVGPAPFLPLRRCASRVAAVQRPVQPLPANTRLGLPVQYAPEAWGGDAGHPVVSTRRAQVLPSALLQCLMAPTRPSGYVPPPNRGTSPLEGSPGAGRMRAGISKARREMSIHHHHHTVHFTGSFQAQ